MTSSDTPGHDAALTVADLCVRYDDDTVLHNVAFSVTRGEILGVMGPPGAGKSTLFKSICGLLDIREGRVCWGDTVLDPAHIVHCAAWRMRVGMAFQNSALFDTMNVFENVAFPLRRRGMTEADVTTKVEENLHAVGLMHAAHKLPRELSGGMQKRVGIARAAVIEPDIGLFDEPTAGLDPQTARAILALICNLTRERGMATMVISSDIGTLVPVCHRIMMLERGRVIFLDSREALAQTTQPMVRQFVDGADAGPL